MIYQCKNQDFWLDEAADSLIEYLKKRPQGFDPKEEIVCSAGMTPSAPIHFGIFREAAITSFVTEELKRRGYNARFVYFWDDFDHFCKIPYFAEENAVKEHAGKMLHEVPDFMQTLNGKEAAGHARNLCDNSYGEHIMRDFEYNLAKCGITPEYDYQANTYRNGTYNTYIEKALKNRKEIFDIFNEHKLPYTQELEQKREVYFPVEVYCHNCRRDHTTVTAFNEKEKSINYVCADCGNKGLYTIGKNFCGKLMWKVNWSARWHDSNVAFESSGENQLTETGSYAVSSRIVKEIFGGSVPFSLLYRFIGVPGAAKLSRALKERALATRFTDVLEPALIRWLLLKNAPNKPFSVDIEENIARLYHEWDVFCQKATGTDATQTERRIYEIAVKGVKQDSLKIPFGKLVMALTYSKDVNGALALLQKAGAVKTHNTAEELGECIKIRLECARCWLFKYGHNMQSLNLQFNGAFYNSLNMQNRQLIDSFAEKIENLGKEEEISALLYDLPKTFAGTTAEIQKLTEEFFCNLYMLLFGTTKGPKLATLFSLLPPETVKTLLGRQAKHGENYE